MPRVFRTKLLVPVFAEAVARPHLLAFPQPRVLVVQAPAGAGKTVFLTQWLASLGGPAVYYQLDAQDRDGAVFAAHLCAGFQACWPDWSPPSSAAVEPGDLAVELVNEAAARSPLVLALDGLEAAFGCAYLSDFLAVVARYAPPGLTLALVSRAPLPADLTAVASRSPRHVGAADLAFTREEAVAWLGEAAWAEVGEGYPLALELWRQHGAQWRTQLADRLRAEMPPHVPAATGHALVSEWLAGRMRLGELAVLVSEAQVGLEQLRTELRAVRELLLLGEFAEAAERLGPLWESARSSGDRPLTGLVALLWGELHYCRGEYAQALDWYGQAFAADPLLRTTGSHSSVAILKDLGQLAEAEELGRQLIDGCQARGDLLALSYAHGQYGAVCTELGRLADAEAHFLEAERIGIKLSGEPFYGILAMAQRAVSYLYKGDMAVYRRTAEEAYQLARRRSPWLAAICGYILVPAFFAWKEHAEGGRLLAQSRAFLTQIDAKWQLHSVSYMMSLLHAEEGAAYLDQALGLAAREGYVQYLTARAVPEAIAGAMVRGVEPAFCQELLLRMGQRAVPALVALTGRAEPDARRAALYPLARIGGEAAAEAVRRLLYDPDEAVRDAALLAFRTLSGPVDTVGPAAAGQAPAAVAAAADGPPPPAVAIALLGPVVVSVGGQRVEGWRTAKARDLIAYLALAGDRPVTRDQIIEALWPETDLENGQALLHTTLYYLRRALKPAGEGLITFAGGAYRLDRERVAIDLERFHLLAAAGTEAGWQDAVALYRGDLLEGLDYAWAEAPRARARAACLDALRRLAEACRRAERWGEAVGWLQRLLVLDPLAEDGHVGLMACYTAQGNRHAALQQYRTLQHALDEELGLEPGAEAQELYRKLLG